MNFKDQVQRTMARIYLRYVSVLFCVIAAISLMFKRPGKKAEKRLLILKPDAIGDYILFRNFLKVIRESEKYRDHHVTFCGNAAYREFAVHFDSGVVDEFIWIDKNRIYLDLPYYVRLARDLYHQYSVTIHASRSRELLFDYVAKISSPVERISHNGDTVNILLPYKRISDRWYSRLIWSGDLFSFEFDANKNFYETLLEQPVSFIKPFLENADDTGAGTEGLPQNFAAIFPGAQLPFRRWSTANFASVCDFIQQKYQLEVVILGGNPDQKLAGEIMQLSHHKLVDLTGKTPLKHLPAVISKARLLVTNDTMAVHIGAAMGIPVVVISQMNHYGRFVPYPHEKGINMQCVIPKEYQKEEARVLTERFKNGSEADINLITVDQVIAAIDRTFQRNSKVEI
jgi:ADP-heptose:LPS heptosyltransferase